MLCAEVAQTMSDLGHRGVIKKEKGIVDDNGRRLEAEGDIVWVILLL